MVSSSALLSVCRAWTDLLSSVLMVLLNPIELSDEAQHLIGLARFARGGLFGLHKAPACMRPDFG